MESGDSLPSPQLWSDSILTLESSRCQIHDYSRKYILFKFGATLLPWQKVNTVRTVLASEASTVIEGYQ